MTIGDRFIRVATFLVVLLGLSTTALAQKEHLFTGRTMGTTYQIKVVAQNLIDRDRLQAQIDARLEQINQSMSTFRSESEISRFNAMQEIHKPFRVSDDFIQVMRVGSKIYHLTEGAWDATVTPLVLLWGFGNAGPIEQLPDPDAIAAARHLVGFDAIGISAQGVLEKRRAGLSVDLASIAKGYGVDQIALVLKNGGFDNFLVEIGGEVYAAGRRVDGDLWRVGINRPLKGGAINAVYKVVALEDRAMATSGDYRNYVQLDGRSYSHIIDPRTGYPVRNGVVSASVMAENCTLADGLATALMVLGPQKGMALLNTMPGVEGLVVVHHSDGSLENHWSKGLADAP
jgi:FAD:protein FMN transferase